MKKPKIGIAANILIMDSGMMPGIYRAYDLVGTSSLFVFLFITLLAGSLALCFAEAAGLFKSNGAVYIYAKEAFGNFVGFEVGFMKYVVQLIAWATMAVGLVTALAAIFPEVSGGACAACYRCGADRCFELGKLYRH